MLQAIGPMRMEHGTFLLLLTMYDAASFRSVTHINGKKPVVRVKATPADWPAMLGHASGLLYQEH